MANSIPANGRTITQPIPPINDLDSGNWRPLGEVIASLMDEVNAAIAGRDEHTAAEAHGALVQAEHEQRVIETVRRLGK